jgi:hypothetical protein
MTVQDRIKKQYRLVLTGLAVGVATGLAGLFWLDNRVLLLGGMAVLAVTIGAAEKMIRCSACGESVYAEVAREAAFSPGSVPRACPKCQADWSQSAVDWS